MIDILWTTARVLVAVIVCGSIAVCVGFLWVLFLVLSTISKRPTQDIANINVDNLLIIVYY